jgi:hypothetical protein
MQYKKATLRRDEIFLLYAVLYTWAGLAWRWFHTAYLWEVERKQKEQPPKQIGRWRCFRFLSNEIESLESKLSPSRLICKEDATPATSSKDKMAHGANLLLE